MADVQVADGYEQAAAAKLWALLPEVHRAEDSNSLDEAGPLRELLERVADQIAVVRRSLDRLWDDQSIESCDSWVMPYIAALVDTNLVPSMDSRGQRLDVANTINYRRRKGTVGLVEQLAADVTGWECRATEFFRSLARTRHGLDPELGWPADAADPAGARRLQLAQRLAGPRTGTPMGGTADLRNTAGGAQTNGPFDEFHHRVDVRRGAGALGWYGIPKLGLFLWNMQSLFVDRATPVPVLGCADHFAFDPTGRQIALWQDDDRPPSGYGEQWRPLDVFQVPGPLSAWVLEAFPGLPLWPGSLSVSPVGGQLPLDQADVEVWPEVGRFKLGAGAPQEVEVGYHYGCVARIGAGPFDRRRIGSPSFADSLPVTRVGGGSATDLLNAVAAVDPTGTIVITDGLTSTAVASPPPVADLCIRAADERRAVVRLAEGDGPWVLESAAVPGTPAGRLRLEGILFSGQDIVLRGGFDEVIVSCCSIDPGTAGDLRVPPTTWEPAVDGRELRPSRIFVEGTVRCLLVDRSFVGPIRTRSGGVIETLSIQDSVVQGLQGDSSPPLEDADVFDADGLLRLLHHQRDPLTVWLAGQLDVAATAAVTAHADEDQVSDPALAAVLSSLDGVIAGPLIYDPARFAGHQLDAGTVAAALAGPTGSALAALNRTLLEQAFPLELHAAALGIRTGLVRVERTTVLGATYVHRLECSESILDDVAFVDDVQHGCVRFSAWCTGSLLPRKYESVRIAPGAPIFTSRRFGEAGYAQLSRGADAAILAADTAGTPSIREGSHGGAEMGVGCSGAAAVKERSLLIKLDEYLPVGLTPVLITMPPPDADGETMRGTLWPPT
jgi:hypothetical protein